MQGPLLAILTRLLEERGGPILPVIEAVNQSGASVAHLMVSALSPKLEVLIPYTADALSAVAPAASPPDNLPPRPLMKIGIDGDVLEPQLYIIGTLAPREAIEGLAPPSARAAWLSRIESLPSGGKINQRLRSITGGRWAIAMAYDTRDAAAEARFVGEIEPLVRMRPAWSKLHAALDPGAALSIFTRCTASGPTNHLGFLYGNGAWDQLVNACTIFAQPAAARTGAAMLGALAATFGAAPRAMEFVFDGDRPIDVIAWVVLQ